MEVYKALAQASLELGSGKFDPVEQGAIEARLQSIMRTGPLHDNFNSDIDLLSGSSPDLLIFAVRFVHRGLSGDRWSDHIVRVTPSFVGEFEIYVSGQDKKGVKGIITDVFDAWLRLEVAEATRIVDAVA